MFVRPLLRTPDLLALHAAHPHQFPFIMISSYNQGWDIALWAETLQVYGNRQGAAFLDQLASIRPQVVNSTVSELPFIGGWFVYLGYELLTEFEPTVPSSVTDTFPLAALARTPAAILLNRASQCSYLVAETPELGRQLEPYIAASAAAYIARPILLNALYEDDPAYYIDAICRLQQYIHAGDVFQVNISRGWKAELAPEIQAVDVFAALRWVNPAPFSALVDLGTAQIISSSPERLVRAQGGWVETRPIAGTHPRSQQAAADEQLKRQLIINLKERAEHVMLIDLARNDLGRICLPGTVEVNELMAVNSYAYVHHIESNIRGQLQPSVRPIDILRALFPGGTITGCPKVRTMQIIRELEPQARRAYTGSLGYINRDGSLDLNILIRTFMQQGQALRFRSGGGIVADSNPERELQETRHKIRGLLQALGISLV